MKKLMKSNIALFTLFLLISISHALTQKSNYEFVGFLNTENNEAISYKIIFSVNKNGEIVGESQTDLFGVNTTKSKIVGEIDKKGKKLSFREIENLSTKSKANPDEFCYVHIDNIKIRTLKNQSFINGEFMGYFPSGQKCVNGTISVVSTEIFELFEEMAKENSTPDAAEKTEKARSLIDFVDQSITTLYKNEELILNWDKNTLIIEVWDDFIEDGDIVSIYDNGKLVLSEYTIRKERKRIEIPINEKIHIIEVRAVNEGSSPPNTVHMLVTDGHQKTVVVAKLNKGDKASIKIHKK
ncbi:MAG: hypothetical protein JJT77_03085 [Crocinitomicaceae bacterium]|nr:hypothetical protein [Crocinitomicaceae bacterium]